MKLVKENAHKRIEQKNDSFEHAKKLIQFVNPSK